MAVDWQWASDFLSRGRKKYERPLYDRGLRIWKINRWDKDSDIAIGWRSYQPFVIFHKDGSTTIQAQQPPTHTWNPLFGYSTRLSIMRYSGIKNLYQRDFKHYIVDEDARTMPPKIQGCRQCKQTGLQDVWCYPQNCWNSVQNADGTYGCPDHPGQGSARWHSVPCAHGDIERGHLIKNGTTCYYCSGTKKRDYGSKLERTLWDGSPIRVRNGNIIKSAATLIERMVADYVRPIA